MTLTDRSKEAGPEATTGDELDWVEGVADQATDQPERGMDLDPAPISVADNACDENSGPSSAMKEPEPQENFRASVLGGELLTLLLLLHLLLSYAFCCLQPVCFCSRKRAEFRQLQDWGSRIFLEWGLDRLVVGASAELGAALSLHSVTEPRA